MVDWTQAVTRGNYLDLARAERSDLLELLRDLNAEEWAKPSLCAGWSTREVVTHLLSHEGVGVGALAVAGVKRFLPGPGWTPQCSSRRWRSI